MKLNDKKGQKAVLFDARDVLERNSKNMERMTVLMDKMYIKLDQKDVSYSPRYIREEEEVRSGRTLDRIIIGEEIDCLVGKETTIVIEVMDKAEVISEEAVFKVGTVVMLEEIIVGIEIEKIGGLGHGQEKEE